MFLILKANYYYYSSDKVLKGTVVNWSLPPVHGGFLKIMLTVPLIWIFPTLLIRLRFQGYCCELAIVTFLWGGGLLKIMHINFSPGKRASSRTSFSSSYQVS